ncbi:MAG TPA: hypothetical protein VFN85_07490 [Solirubrobacterales bacterium]|nr:hypothetical protein [Solirubrobacterales bacterium]
MPCRSLRRGPLFLMLLLTALTGCGSGGDASSAPTTAHPRRSFRYYPEQHATAQRISASDCRRLAAVAARHTERKLRHASEPTPPNSRCQLEGRDVHVSITLDTAYAARQRYENRMAEQVQFNAPYPAKDPHHVPGVGDRAAGEHFASWIPAYSTLYAVRGNRWLTLAYSVTGESRPRRLAAAVALARLAFGLTAR